MLKTLNLAMLKIYLKNITKVEGLGVCWWGFESLQTPTDPLN